MAKKKKVKDVEKVEVKKVIPKYTEEQKQFIKDNNMDEYIHLFGKPE